MLVSVVFYFVVIVCTSCSGTFCIFNFLSAFALCSCHFSHSNRRTVPSCVPRVLLPDWLKVTRWVSRQLKTTFKAPFSSLFYKTFKASQRLPAPDGHELSRVVPKNKKKTKKTWVLVRTERKSNNKPIKQQVKATVRGRRSLSTSCLSCLWV